MMKRFFRGFLTAIASLALIVGLYTPSQAATNYNYTIKFLVGTQGTFNSAGVSVYDNNGLSKNADVKMNADKTVITVSGLEYGSRITFDLKAVDVSNGSKYYVKGIRESGMDNNTISTNSFQVNKDVDYVVGYALLADSVAYTIEYVDNKGNTLAPSETHYGNVGDRPVVAFLYMDGYLPQAYNLTGTLYKDPADNIFRFVYTPLSELPDYYRGYTDRGIIDNGITGDGGVYVIPGDGGGAGAGGAGGAGGGQEGVGENGEGNITDIEGEETPQGPAEIIDIRDEEAALSDGEGIFGGLMDELGIKVESPSAFFTSIPVGAKIAIVGALALILAVAAYFLFIRRIIRNKKDER
ncbi:MAG: hypothetical protein K5669_03135 [Lachnospiraceae bacterium]|nr:hypothetical protein [Lachnospiraceae bacterium]